MKKFSFEILTFMVCSTMSIGELDETVDGLFDQYKHLKAKQKLSGLTGHEVELLKITGERAIEAAKEANKKTKTLRWETTLPTDAQIFAREHDNKYHEELHMEVAASATRKKADGPTPDGNTDDTQIEPPSEDGLSLPDQASDTAKNVTAETPAAANAESGEAKAKRKGRLDDATVEEIRAHLKQAPGTPGKLKQGEIAKKYNIDASTVSDIKVGRGRYKDAVVEDPAVEVPATETPAPVVEATAAEGTSEAPEATV